MTRAGFAADIFLFGFFLVKRKSCAEEVRAIVPLPKGTEVLFPYQVALRDRAGRRASLKSYGFVCNCELCALPDDLSNALDTKINLANNASDYLGRFFERQERDAIRALQFLDIFMSGIIRERLFFQFLDIFMSGIIRERLFFDYTHFFAALRLFHILGNPILLQQVGKAILGVLQRHLGTGVYDGAAAETLALYLDESKRLDTTGSKQNYLSANGDHTLNAQLEKTASSIISNIQNLL
jgi:hypothetical protein